jgi:histidinol-phosphate aminotransferase
LIADLNTIKHSTNPYNVNRMTAAVGYATLCEQEWFENCCKTICDNRAYTTEQLRKMGFEVLDSKTNFVFVRSDKIKGAVLYQELKKRGILVRHFNGGRVEEYNRITIGTREQMDVLLKAIEAILKEVTA